MRHRTPVIGFLLGVALVAASADDQVDFTVDGSATATFGIDLQNQVMGFANTNTAELSVELITEQSASRGSDAPV